MIKRWFYYPALFFLLVTLLSGSWLRLQWGWPQWQVLGLELPWSLFFRSEHLLHGHSHVALLGWAFLALTGLVLEAGTRRSRLPVRALRVLAASTILITSALFIAFLREGYAPLSIALSTLHMFLTYAFAWIFFRHARSDSNTGSRYFLEGAVFWMVMASAGPLLLAAGGGLSPLWMDAAVRYYLHLLFNGWLLFALAGLSFRYLIVPRYQQKTWPFWLMMAGVLPALLPALQGGSVNAPGLTGFPSTVAGIFGTLLFAAGGMAVVYYTLVSVWHRRVRRPGTVLFWVGLAAAVPVLLLPVITAWPSVRNHWMQSDFLVIGFIHIHLLTAVTGLLLYAITQRLSGSIKSSSNGTPVFGPAGRVRRRRPVTPVFMTDLSPPVHEAPPGSTRLPISPGIRSLICSGSLVYLAGSTVMVALLVLTGLFQLSGSHPPFPVQKSLFQTGFLAFIGVSLMTAALVFRPGK